MMTPILFPENDANGFAGTIARSADINEAWAVALEAVRRATGSTDEAVRAFLDSGHGRHFADEVIGWLGKGFGVQQAVEAAVEHWSDMTISRRTARLFGIPAGYTYLDAFVTQYEIPVAA
jgi:hypothetical protein